MKRARLLQWLVFFRQTTDLIVYVPLFSTTRFTVNQRSRVRVLALARNFFEHLRKRTSLKGPLLQFFFATVRLILIFFCLQRVPPSSFLYFAAYQSAKKPKGYPLLSISALWRQKFSKKIKIFGKK